jgi:hypothetical protein
MVTMVFRLRSKATSLSGSGSSASIALAPAPCTRVYRTRPIERSDVRPARPQGRAEVLEEPPHRVLRHLTGGRHPGQFAQSGQTALPEGIALHRVHDSHLLGVGQEGAG